MILRMLLAIAFVFCLVYLVDRMFVVYDYTPDVVHVYNACGRSEITFAYTNKKLVDRVNDEWNKAIEKGLNPIEAIADIPFVHFVTNEIYIALSNPRTNIVVSYIAEHTGRIRNRHRQFFDVDLGDPVRDKCIICGHELWVKEDARFKRVTSDAMVYCTKCEQYVMVPHSDILVK